MGIIGFFVTAPLIVYIVPQHNVKSFYFLSTFNLIILTLHFENKLLLKRSRRPLSFDDALSDKEVTAVALRSHIVTQIVQLTWIVSIGY